MVGIEQEPKLVLEPYVAPAIVLETTLEVRAGTELGLPDLFGDLTGAEDNRKW